MKLHEVLVEATAPLSDFEKLVKQFCRTNRLFDYKINGDEVDFEGQVILSRKTITKLPFKFGKVTGYFKVSGCNLLESLENFPHTITGDFVLENCPGLVTLKGCPKTVNVFILSKCNGLKVLDYGPETITRDFSCTANVKLNSIRGVCKDISGDVKIIGNPLLTNFHGLPPIAKNNVIIRNNGNKTLEGLYSEKINGNLRIISDDNLESLKGSPKYVVGDFDVNGATALTSFEGGPTHIGGTLKAYGTGISSLKGCPETIGGDFDISFSPGLTEFDQVPHSVKGTISAASVKNAKNFLMLLEIRDAKKIETSNVKLSEILTKWLPTQNIAKAQQELEKAGLGEYAEY